MAKATITPSDNGPYLVQGSATVLDAEGNQYQVTDTIALCRCGHSSTKPFIDTLPRLTTVPTDFATAERVPPFS